MSGVAGEGAAVGARIQAQALKDTGTGFNFLRPGPAAGMFKLSLTPFCVFLWRIFGMKSHLQAMIVMLEVRIWDFLVGNAKSRRFN